MTPKFLPILPLLVFAFAPSAKTEAEIKQTIVQESIKAYPGTCPCPESLDRNDVTCGKRSVYTRLRGFEPRCYPSDVTAEMVRSWKTEHSVRKGTK